MTQTESKPDSSAVVAIATIRSNSSAPGRPGYVKLGI
jgi:hypothetical protein